MILRLEFTSEQLRDITSVYGGKDQVNCIIESSTPELEFIHKLNIAMGFSEKESHHGIQSADPVESESSEFDSIMFGDIDYYRVEDAIGNIVYVHESIKEIIGPRTKKILNRLRLAFKEDPENEIHDIGTP